MGKDTGYLEYARQEVPTVPAEDRVCSFGEFHLDLSPEERILQGARCMNCGVPLCQSGMELGGMITGCPLHNLIPEWNHEVYRGHISYALARLLKTNNFPEFTGRVCPALCEKACILGQDDLPVTAHDNERYIIETAFRDGLMQPRVPKIRSGKRVAVVGSGPAGLAAADQLNHRGHSVTVFERDDRIGGLLMYGIPNMKLDKAVIARRRMLMEAEGVVFRTGTDVGRDIPAEDLTRTFDAVLLCGGARQPRSLPCLDGRTVKGAWFAVDFLTATTKAILKGESLSASGFRAHRGCPSAEGKHVVIVGGGDTGNDCIATVLRHGCRSVTALEMLPAPPDERAASNPWPEWPKVRKTDYGHEEAVRLFGSDPRVFETTVKECVTDSRGALKKIVTVRGRFGPGGWEEEAGSEQILPCDLLLIAAGFTGCEPYTAEAFGLSRTPRGTLQTAPDSCATALPGVFAAGDMRRGPSLVVRAIAEGRVCAREADRFLMGYTPL